MNYTNHKITHKLFHLGIIATVIKLPFLYVHLLVLDIDECEMGEHECSIHAICNNTNGSYMCECQPGYTEDGKNCTG